MTPGIESSRGSAADRRRPTARLAPAAVGAVFTMFGLLGGALSGVLPSLRERLHTSASGLSMLLLVGAFCAIAGIQVSGRLADRYGARRVTLGFLVPLIVGVAALGMARSLGTALACVVLTGLGKGGSDTSMNALGVQVERARAAPIMSRLHAMYSVGVLSGSGLVAVVPTVSGRSGARVAPVVLLAIAALSVAGWLALLRALPDPPPRDHEPAAPRPRRAGAGTLVWELAALNVALMLIAGTAADWSSVQVTDVGRVDAGTGAFGLTAFSAAMMAVRFGGDGAIRRIGRVRAVRAGAVVALAGYLVVVTASPFALLLVGWAVVGAGVAVIAPSVYAAAAYLGGGRTLAVVTSAGSLTSLAAPPLIGAVYHWQGPRAAMLIPLVLCLVTARLAGALRPAVAAPVDQGVRVGGDPAPG